MKHALLILLIVAVAAGIAYAEPDANMSKSGDFSASTVLWFSDTNVTVQVSGDLTLKKDLIIGDTTHSQHQPRGTLSGSAKGRFIAPDDAQTMQLEGAGSFTSPPAMRPLEWDSSGGLFRKRPLPEEQ